MGKIEQFPTESEFSFFGSVNEKSSYRLGLMGTKTIPTPVERLSITFPSQINDIDISDAIYVADETGEFFSFCGQWVNPIAPYGYLVLENQLVSSDLSNRVLHIAKVSIDKTVFDETADVFNGYVFVQSNGRIGFAYKSGSSWVINSNVLPPNPMKVVAISYEDLPTAQMYLDEIRFVFLIQEKNKPYVVSGLSNFYTKQHDQTINQRFRVYFNNQSDINFFNNPSQYWIYPYIIKSGAVFALDRIDGAVVQTYTPTQKRFLLTVPNNNDLFALGVDFVFRRNPSLVFNNNTNFRGVLSFNDRLVYWTNNRIYITDTGTLMTWGTAFEATEGVGGYVSLNNIITCKDVGGQLFAFTPYGVFVVGEVATGVWGVKRTELPSPIQANNRWIITSNIYLSETGFVDLRTRELLKTNTEQLENALLSADGIEGVLLCVVDTSKLPTHLRQQRLFLVRTGDISAFPRWALNAKFVRIQGGFIVYGLKDIQTYKVFIHEWLPNRFVPVDTNIDPKKTIWTYERSFPQEVYLKRWGLSLRLITDLPTWSTGRLRALLKIEVFEQYAPTKRYWVLRPLKVGENRFILPSRIRGSHFRFTLTVGYETFFGGSFSPNDERSYGALMDLVNLPEQNAVFSVSDIAYGDYEISDVWYEYVMLERSEGGLKR